MRSTLSTHSREDPAVTGAELLASEACQRARALGESVSATLVEPVTTAGVDPLAVLQALADPTQFAFHWEVPRRGFALSGGGTALELSAGGAERFEALSRHVEAAWSRAVVHGTEEDGGDGTAGNGTAGSDTETAGADRLGAPLVVGGLSFFEDLDPARWPGFLPAQLVMPAWVVLRSEGRTRMLISTVAAPDDAPEAVAARLTDLLDAVRAAVYEVSRADHGSRTPRESNRAFHLEHREDGHDPWVETVRFAREAIRNGELSKVVLARALDVVCEAPPSPYAMLRRLRTVYPECYNFYIQPGAGTAFLGATPETLARFGADRVELAALASTAPRDERPEVDEAHAQRLLDSPKERQEHQIVVDGLVQALRDLGRVSYQDTPRVMKLSNVQHLYTPITLEPDGDLQPLLLLARVHPSAAVGGQPREQAFRLIRRLEHFDRGWYGAPVGWLDARGRGEFAVALRAGTLSGDRLRLFAGGGIVADSEPEREFEETRIKFQPLLSALAGE